MTKDDIKRYLREKGASTVLIQMPAVMERIYSYYEATPESIYSGYTGTISPMREITPEQLRSSLLVEKGNITIQNGSDLRQFKTRPNGEAIYINANKGILGIDEIGEYPIDEFGMDKGYRRKKFKLSRTKAGMIVGKNQEFPDDGSPILNIGNYINPTDSIKKGDPEKLNNRWIVNKEEMTANYPNTIQWFEYREGKRIRGTRIQENQEPDITIRGIINDRTDQFELSTPREVNNREQAYAHFSGKTYQQAIAERDERIENLQVRDRENQGIISKLRQVNKGKEDSLVRLQQENQEKDAQISNLQAEKSERDKRISDLLARNSTLQERINKLQDMLSTALDKLQQIKSSFLGRFFFSKEERRDSKRIKRLPEGKELPPGTQER